MAKWSLPLGTQEDDPPHAAIEEIIVRADQDKKSLELVLHWKREAYTHSFRWTGARSATGTATPIEALEIIPLYGSSASGDRPGLLSCIEPSRLSSTGKGKRWQSGPGWPQPGVTIPLPVKSEPYLIRRELVWAKQRAYATSVIARSGTLGGDRGILEREQVTPRAPWEIRRSDLDTAPIRRIIDHLHRKVLVN